ncbi:hypothetical protein [Algoriphagus pacificus]|uniref:DUF4221 domain-containing protein n=1 Tax=Algoriphagus pacificus TaxID=2811234 RepID=A0ABS3CLY4_9BACT|nr:hypothetical protein [Algoriphagus pacificus]MBN7818090.1 hypothetical protein [Algoriphagus pacificus]
MVKILLNLFLVVFFTIIFISCGEREEIQNSGFELIKVGEKSFKIDSVTTPLPQDIQLLYGIDTLFVTLNSPKNEIQFYNFNSTQIVQKKVFDENFFGILSDFYVHNNDSIFVSSISKKRAWLVNEKLEILRSFDLAEAVGTSLPIGNENVIYLKGKLIISTQLAIFDSKGVEEEPLIFVFDLENSSNQPEYQYLNYPEVYEDSFSPELGLYYTTFDINSGMIFHGFSAYNWLYTFNLEGEKIDSLKISPQYDFEIKNSTNRDLENVNTRQYYYYNNYNYGYLLVNNSKNIIFRIFYSPMPNLEKSTPIKFDDLKPKSIIISDLISGQHLGQFKLSEKLNEGLMFSHEDNIYINKIQDNEDEIVFEIFNINN